MALIRSSRPSATPVLLCALALSLAGCTRKTEGGLLLTITLEPGVRGDCLVVDAFSGSARLNRSLLARTSGKDAYRVGIARGDFPQTLTWQVTAYQGRCSEETSWKLAARSAEVERAFPDTGVEPFAITVGLPDATLDGDRDGFVDTGKGGTDCDDANAMVKPGAAQVCASPVDTDCNGQVFCADPGCAGDPSCTRRATGVAFETPLVTLMAAECSGPQAVVSVAQGMPAGVSERTQVTLLAMGSSAAGVQFFSDGACTTPLATPVLTLEFGTSRVPFSFRAPRAGTLTVTGSTTSLGSSSFTTTITDRPVARLALTPTATSVRAGTCSEAIQVEALDDRMMPTNVPSSGLPLQVTFNPPGTTTVRVYSDATCTTEGSLAIAAGVSNTRFWVRATQVTPAQDPIEVQVGSPTVNNGMPVDLALTVTPGAPDGVEFLNSIVGLRNQACPMTPAELQLIDANGNPTTAEAGGVSLTLAFTPPSVGGGTLTFFPASGCQAGTAVTSITVPQGQSRVSLWMQAVGPGTYQVRATASGLVQNQARVQVDVATMEPTAFVFANPAVVSATAGACSGGIRLQTRESNSTSAPVSPVASSLTVTIESTPASVVTLFRDPSCAPASRLTNNDMMLSAGSSELTFYFSGTVARDFTLKASSLGSGLSETNPPQNGRIVPGNPMKMVFLPPSSLSAVAGQCSSAFSLRALDAFDNQTNAFGVITPAATPLIATTGAFFSSSPACASAGPSPSITVTDGGTTFYARAESARQYSISVTGLAASTMPATFTVDAGAPMALRVTQQPTAIVTSGACVPVELERIDAFGNPAAGVAQPYVPAATVPGIASVHDDPGCTTSASFSFAAAATRSTFYVRARLVGSTTFGVTGIGSAVTTTAMQVNAGPASRLRFATNSPPATSTVGVCAVGTVERTDAEGNLATTGPNAATVMASGAGSQNGLRLDPGSSCLGSTQLSAALTFVGPTITFAYDPRATGMLTFSVSGNGLAGTMGSTNVQTGGVAQLRFINPPTGDQLNYGCVPFEVEALDVGMNRVASATTVNLSSTSTGSFFTTTDCSGSPLMPATGSIPAGGTLQFRYQPQQMGSLVMSTVTASAGVGTPPSQTLTIVPGDPARLTRPNFASPTLPATTACINFPIERVDRGGIPTTRGGALTVAAALSGPASMAPRPAELFAGGGCTTPLVSGTIDIPVAMSSVSVSVKLRKTGDLTLSTTTTATGVTAPVDTLVNVVAGALASMTLNPDPPAASIGVGACSPVITVSGFDAESNPAALGTQALTMAGASFFSNATCTMGIGNLNAGTSTTGTFHFSHPMAGTRMLTVGATVVSVSQSWTIDPPPVTGLRIKSLASTNVTRFACTGPFRVETINSAMMTVMSGSMRTLALGGTGVQYFSDSACSTPVTAASIASAGDTETGDLWFVPLDAPAADLNVTTTGLSAAAASLTVGGQMGARSLVATLAQPDVEYRGCVALTIERQAGGMPLTASSFTTRVTLGRGVSSTARAGSFSYYLTNDCTGSSVTEVALAGSAASALVYVLGRSSPTPMPNTVASALLTADDVFAGGFGSDTENANIHPAVRRGTCTITNNTSSANCLIQPALPPTPGVRNRSFFSFQATPPGGNTAANISVACSLDTGAANIACSRASSPNSSIVINWELLSFGRGVSVQHFETSISMATPRNVNLGSPFTIVPVENTFVLTSTSRNGGNMDWDDYPSVKLGPAAAALADGGSVHNLSFDYPGTATTVSSQVVTWEGLTVASGVMGTSSGATWSVTGAPPLTAGVTSALLFTTQLSAIPGGDTSAICRFRARGSLSGATPGFSRGAGATGNCDDTDVSETVWQRLDFPGRTASVLSFGASMAIRNTLTSESLLLPRPVSLDRTWSFLSGQGPNGQATGETNRGDGNNDSDLNATLARISYDGGVDAGIFTLSRTANQNLSRFGAFVIELAP